MNVVYALFITDRQDADCHSKLVGLFTTKDGAQTEAKFLWNPKQYSYEIEKWDVK